MIRVFKYLLIFLLFPLAAQSQIDKNCGVFLLRVEYIMARFSETYAFEIKNDCNKDVLVMETNLFSPYDKTSDTILLQKEEIQYFMTKTESISLTEWKESINIYLVDGLLITYTYISRNEDLFQNRIDLPKRTQEELDSVQAELKVFDYLVALAQEKFGDEVFKIFHEHMKHYRQ